MPAGWVTINFVHFGKAYEGACRIPRPNGDGRGNASASFVWIAKAIEPAARPQLVCRYQKSISNIYATNNVLQVTSI